MYQLILIFCLSGACHEFPQPGITSETVQQCNNEAQFRAIEWLNAHAGEPWEFHGWRCGEPGKKT